MELQGLKKVFIQQMFEGFELLGFETRNKYRIFDEHDNEIGFAAEQQKGFFGFLMRQFLGHWRTFEIHFFSHNRKPVFKAVHPFRFFFQRLEVFDESGSMIGAVQQRFALISKKFDIQDRRGNAILSVRSPIWKIWSFPFYKAGNVGSEIHKQAHVQKKWSGFLNEVFTDKDKFMVEYTNVDLDERLKKIVLAAALFVDLVYFEKKASND